MVVWWVASRLINNTMYYIFNENQNYIRKKPSHLVCTYVAALSMCTWNIRECVESLLCIYLARNNLKLTKEKWLSHLK